MESGVQYLIDSNSNIMYCSDSDKIAKKLDTDMLDITGESGYYIGKFNGEKSLIIYYLSYQTNWTAIITIPIENILKDYQPIKITMIVIAIVYIMFLIFMIVLLEKSVITPVRILTSEMDSFAEGNLNAQIDNKLSGELGRMNRHFNNMTVRIVDLMKKNELEVKEKNDFKMQALTAQLNPHFIYNSLNTIKWMAVINKQDNIHNLTNALIKILMNSSKVKDDYYTVSDEIELIQNYGIIQKARFMNFDIEYRIDDSAKKCKIRKFLLQPVVENAIIHGFSRGMKRNGNVIITAYCDDKLHIQISDNGKGFDVELWEKAEESIDNNHTNIALKNIKQIITLEYGSEYGINIVSDEEVGTRVDYLFPIIRER
jgi:sensor histidine kinase YesM